MQAIDVSYAYSQMKSVITALEKIRKNARTEKIFDDTTKLRKKLHGEHFEIEKPRTTGRQAHRSNPDVESAEDFFRITLLMSLHHM